MRALLAALLIAASAALPAAASGASTADAGALRARLDGDRAVFTDARGAIVVVASPVSSVAVAGEGVIALRGGSAGGGGPVRFEDDSRLFGTGSRSDAVDRRGRATEAYVCDGPFRPADRLYPRALVPPWASCERDDATYFPLPWVLSARGYGVLADHDERVTIDARRGDGFTIAAEAPALGLRVFAGPTPADALRRFTRDTGRQPAPPQPWAYGPWIQTGQPNVVPLAEEAAIVGALQAADAPVSAAETQMHFLPCGAHEADPAYNRARTAQYHRLGLAHLVYVNPLLCTSYSRLWQEAAAAGALQLERLTGLPHIWPAFVGGAAPLGFSAEPLSQFDFTSPAGRDLYARMVRTVLDGGHDGWMEDFGESTSPSVAAADGTPGTRLHNRYPTDYHCAVAAMAPDAVRFSRSGWTGTARCTVNVWGGDPTTVWGYDGLASAVKQALSIGLSGVSRFATDIGGYNTFGSAQRLTGELLDRWIQVGALLPVMRTKRSGLALPPYERPQVFDPGHIGMWRRYARLHTRLYPYLVAADAEYRATGLPIVRHMLLAAPSEPSLWDQEDAYALGSDLLIAPALSPGQTKRTLRAPRGRWIDLWRSASPELSLGRAHVMDGGRELELPAPRDELPLLVRAGTVLPLLAADVDSLSPYKPDRPDVIRLADRADRLTLLAWPRGRSTARAYERDRLVSTETRRGWTLQTRFTRRLRVSLEASLVTLRRPFRPCGVRIGGRRHRFRYDRATGVLRVNFTARRASLRVRRCVR